jgi:adenylosuccinate lyase
LVSQPLSFTGLAQSQVGQFVRRVEALVKRHPQALAYQPEAIL